MKIRVALCGIIGMLATHASLAGDCKDLTLPLSVVDLAHGAYHGQPQQTGRVTDLLADTLVATMRLPDDASRSATHILAKGIVARLLADSKSVSELHTGLTKEAAALCQLASRQPSPPAKQPAAADTVVGKLDELEKNTEAMIEGDAENKSAIMRSSFDNLLDLHTRLFDRRDKLIRDVERARLNEICGNDTGDFSQCSRKIFMAIQRRKMSMEENLTMAKSLGAAAEQSAAIQTLFDEKLERYKDAVAQEALRAPFYGLYAGPSFLLNEEGGFDEGLEVFASFNTGAGRLVPFGKFSRGVFDARFLSESAFPSEVEEGEGLPVDVFKSKGELRLRAMGQVHLTDLFGLEFGLGATSLASEDSSFSRVEPRLDFGLRFQTSYPDRAIGELVLGYSHDESWRRRLDTDGDLTTTQDQVTERQFDRYFVDGTLLFPNLELGGFSLAARLSANFPTSGSSPSELRASILLYYPFNTWLEKFKPGVAKPAQ